jgi:hypothetical protein
MNDKVRYSSPQRVGTGMVPGDTCIKSGTVFDLRYMFGKVIEEAKKSQGKLR